MVHLINVNPDLLFYIIILNMVVGRFELIPFIAMLHPDFWVIRQNRW